MEKLFTNEKETKRAIKAAVDQANKMKKKRGDKIKHDNR